eukprot:187536_1
MRDNGITQLIWCSTNISDPYEYYQSLLKCELATIYTQSREINEALIKPLDDARKKKIKLYADLYNFRGKLDVDAIVEDIITNFVKLNTTTDLHLFVYQQESSNSFLTSKLHARCKELNHSINISSHESPTGITQQNLKRFRLTNNTDIFCMPSKPIGFEDAAQMYFVSYFQREMMIFGPDYSYYSHMAKQRHEHNVIDSELAQYLYAAMRLYDAELFYVQSDSHQALFQLLTIDPLWMESVFNALQSVYNINVTHMDLKQNNGGVLRAYDQQIFKAMVTKHVFNVMEATKWIIREVRNKIDRYCSSERFQWEDAIAKEIVRQYAISDHSTEFGVFIYESHLVNGSLVTERLLKMLNPHGNCCADQLKGG